MKPLRFTNFKTAQCFNLETSVESHNHKIAINSFKNHHGSPRLQAGDFLIEAIIGLVLMAIIAVGVTTITSKVEVGKRQMSVQDLAVSQLRELLVNHGNGTVNLCDSTPETITLPDATLTVTATGCNTTTGTVNGTTLSGLKQPIVLSAGTDTGTYGRFTVGGVQTQ
ncbi:MAG: hypothetical protein RL497_1585 [Pseudomonadota bacterium]|jgi:hypothetical protein